MKDIKICENCKKEFAPPKFNAWKTKCCCRRCSAQLYYKNNTDSISKKSHNYYEQHYKPELPIGKAWTLREKEQDIINYYLLGNSQEATAKNFGVTQGAIWTILKKQHIEIREHIRLGDKNPNWKGGVLKDKDGRKYIYSPNHPNPDIDGIYCYEYRLIMEKELGRYLNEEIVHHINGDVTDNRPENLQVMTQTEHINLHRIQGDLHAAF